MIAVDWGTSSLRVYRLDANGKVRATRSSSKGILNIGDATFATTLESEAGDWIDEGEQPIVMSGMIGSRQGWVEADYVSCPAGVSEIASSMSEVTWGTHSAWLAPGLRCRHPAGVYDVMRGEEVQVLGIADQLDGGEHRICLPGTHSKWVSVRDHKIVAFTTHMTGEVFSILKEHSILGHTMTAQKFSKAAFLDGVARAGQANGLLHHLFGVRAQVLSDELAQDASAAYLSGILIGHELSSATSGQEVIHLLGSAELTDLYSLAANAMSIGVIIHEADAVARGLYALAQRLAGQA